MIVILKENPNQKQLENLKSWLTGIGLTIHESEGVNHRILGLVGDTSRVDIDLIQALDIVEDVKRIQEPYKNANRKFHPLDTVVEVQGRRIGVAVAAALRQLPPPLRPVSLLRFLKKKKVK